MIIYHTWNAFNEKFNYFDNHFNVYYSMEYELFEKNRGNSCIYVGDDKTVIVVVVWKKFIFRWAEFPSEPVYMNTNDRDFHNEQSFLDRVIDCIKSQGICWLSASGTSANFCAYPTKSKRIPFGNYIVDLSVNAEDIFSNVTSKCRNMIRKAEKDGVIINQGGEELLDKYILADKDTWERSGSDVDYRLLYNNYLLSFRDNARIFIAQQNGVVQGGAIYVFNKEVSYYVYGASINKPSPGAMNLLHYTAMLYFKKLGVHFYSFVGCRINEDKDSKYHGIQRFKSSFGGTLTQGFMFKDTSNSVPYVLFSVVYKIKNHTKEISPDIIDQEIHKWIELNS